MFESYWEERQKRPSIWVERTTITKSATAAAGSGDLHAYRRFKRAETLKRIEDQEDDIEKQDHDEYQKARVDKMQRAQELTQKKHEKREKQKLKDKLKKQNKKLQKEAEKLNQFENDGTFLEKLLGAEEVKQLKRTEKKAKKIIIKTIADPDILITQQENKTE